MYHFSIKLGQNTHLEKGVQCNCNGVEDKRKKPKHLGPEA